MKLRRTAIFVLLGICAPIPAEFAFAQPAPAPAPPPPAPPAPPPPAPPPADPAAPPAPPADPALPPADPAAPPDPAKPAGAHDWSDVTSDGEDPKRPPAAGKGVVWGVVRSSERAETLIEAQVSVVGTKFRALTDIDGRYRLELPPGVYDLRIFYELHKAIRVRNVRVVAGRVAPVDIVLQRNQEENEAISAVEADIERGSTATQFMLRRNSAVASDAIGAQEIARSPDRNAADAAKRVVGATIVDSRYVYVRGLGERYTNALLNGTPLPSPEPDKQAVPLDIFPAVLISDLTILKTFSPDIPGDFAGGSLIIHTRDFPSKFQFQASVNGGVNSEATFASRLSLPESGKFDFLGMDDGTRALPGGLPTNRLNDIDANGNRIDLSPYGRALNSRTAPRGSTSPPNFGGNLVVGDTLRLGTNKNHLLGWQGALSYGRTYLRRTNEIIRTYAGEPGGGPLRQLNDYTAETGTSRTQWSTFGSLGYSYGANHRLTLTGVLTRTGEAEARQITGFNEERAAAIEDTRLRFISRQLAFGQLRGEHKFAKAGNATLTWTTTLAQATLDDPDLRNNVFTFDQQTGRRTYEDGPLSGLHFFAKQKERTIGGTVDWLQPIVEGKKPVSLKFGGLIMRRKRDFSARRFVFRRRPGVDPSQYQLPADELFTNANIGPVLLLDEQTRANDAYEADYDVTAGYLMTDVALTERLRMVIGPRVERSDQTIDSFDQFAPDTRRLSSTLARTDLLPAFNAIYKVTDNQNVRLSASQTVARPQLRELAPFSFSDYFGGRDVQGNPDLDRTKIVNLDARYEWFPGLTEVLAVSFFYKRFSKPIEQIILQSSRGIVTFQNAKGAENFGMELEIRKGLGFLFPRSKVMRDLTGMFNVTAVHSQVELEARSDTRQTNAERPLAGQSPYVFNIALDYTNDESGTRLRALYNVSGPRISQVGAFELPDVYEQPRNVVDLTAGQKIGDHVDLRLTIENILNAPYRFTHGRDGEQLVNRYVTGTNAMLFATYTN